jgi:hypothetical protein
MAEFKKADSMLEWFDQRLGVINFAKVMMTEYWIPKKYQLFVGNGGFTYRNVYLFGNIWNFSFDVLQTRC